MDKFNVGFQVMFKIGAMTAIEALERAYIHMSVEMTSQFPAAGEDFLTHGAGMDSRHGVSSIE